MGRTTAIVKPDGSTTTYQSQGNETTVTDAADKWKKFTLNAFGNLVKVNEPNPAGGADYETFYASDMLDRLVQVQMPRGGTT